MYTDFFVLSQYLANYKLLHFNELGPLGHCRTTLCLNPLEIPYFKLILLTKLLVCQMIYFDVYLLDYVIYLIIDFEPKTFVNLCKNLSHTSAFF